MSTRWYPIYQKGNPQLRIFLPDFWLKLIKPHHKQPKNVVQFMAPTEMSDVDIKNYLEKIYKVPVAHVESKIEEGELKRQRVKGYVIKGPDFRRAFVTLLDGNTFEFPNICQEKEKEEESEYKKLQKEMADSYKVFKEKNKSHPGIPGWFGI
ncbi:39S ribosomal protein L23, mitochondrial [Cimex lectularius]|uniref:Large ribosomal subunit protein uL23m n=1 Tax=Cimex lectularius TaxID=79782 RepID=A0A8I6RZ24_CIMLE|nr:39S ribosomal protein L23, mitochondrial [Cimex lectularius]